MEHRYISMGDTIAALRRERNMTQLELAQMLGVTNQAVSKWESDQCCPDIMLLPELADAFGISIDALFGRQEPEPRQEVRIRALPWTDDGALRAVCFQGHTLVDYARIRSASVELHHNGSAGSIYSDFSVTCENCTVTGNVNAGTGVICGAVQGDVTAGDWVTCGNVGRDVSAGDNVTCSGSIQGSVTAGESIRCGNIGGNAFAGVGIECRSIRGPGE